MATSQQQPARKQGHASRGGGAAAGDRATAKAAKAPKVQFPQLRDQFSSFCVCTFDLLFRPCSQAYYGLIVFVYAALFQIFILTIASGQ